MADKKRSKSGKRSKRSKDGKRRKSRKSKGSGSRGGFYRVDAQGIRCPSFENSKSPLGADCFWAMRRPGVPKVYQRLMGPQFVRPEAAQLLNAANPMSGYLLRAQQGLGRRDARAVTEWQAMQGGPQAYNQYLLGRALQRGKLGSYGQYLASGAVDPRMYGGRGFGQMDPFAMMMAMGRGK